MALVIVWLIPTQVMAAGPDEEFEFTIPAARLETSLKSLSRQTGYSVIYQSADVEDLKTNPLAGRYTLQQALDAFLQGTELTGGVTGSGVITISRDTSVHSQVQGDAMSSKNSRNIFAGVAAAVLSIFTNQGAIGQNVAGQGRSSAPAAAGELEEIVVTAQRREASLQDLALSVRALTGEELQRLGAVRIEDYAGFVPGLELIEYHGSQTQIEMRGVTLGAGFFDQPQFRPTVGIYLDESPIAAQYFNADIALMDLERIEVMRGPQATLYGAGSLSGSIRMITKKPELAEFEGRLGAGGSYTEHGGGNFDVEGMVNVPVIKDELAFRAVGFYRDQAGYIDNPVLGKENVNDNRDVGGRLGLRYEPTDYFRLDVSFAYQDSDADSSGEFYEEAGDLNAQYATPTPFDSELMVASLVAEVDFNVGTLTSATSYFGNQSQDVVELARFIRFLTGILLDAPPSADDFIDPDIVFLDRDEFTQELRFVSKDEGRVSWIAGLLFQQQNHSYGEDWLVPGIDAFTGIPSTLFSVEPDKIYKSRIDIETTQLSLFGEASVTVFDRLTVKAGLRWFYAAEDSATFFGGIFAAPIGTASADHSENGINPTVNVSYQIDDERMIYLQAARGFRLGGPICRYRQNSASLSWKLLDSPVHRLRMTQTAFGAMRRD